MELERKAAEMERFIYTVSHDLRSPLITVGGFLGFLKIDLENVDSERTCTELRMIEDAVVRMDLLLGPVPWRLKQAVCGRSSIKRSYP